MRLQSKAVLLWASSFLEGWGGKLCSGTLKSLAPALFCTIMNFSSVTCVSVVSCNCYVLFIWHHTTASWSWGFHCTVSYLWQRHLAIRCSLVWSLFLPFAFNLDYSFWSWKPLHICKPAEIPKSCMPLWLLHSRYHVRYQLGCCKPLGSVTGGL